MMNLARGNSAIKLAVDSGAIRVDLNTGVIYGKRNRPVGKVNRKGYVRIGLTTPDGKLYGAVAHRVVAYVMYGDVVFDEDLVVHHINGDKTDNRASNLELVSLNTHMKLTFPDSKTTIKDWYGIMVGDEIVGCVDNEEDARLISERHNGQIVTGKNPRKLFYPSYQKAVNKHRQKKRTLNP